MEMKEFIVGIDAGTACFKRVLIDAVAPAEPSNTRKRRGGTNDQ